MLAVLAPRSGLPPSVRCQRCLRRDPVLPQAFDASGACAAIRFYPKRSMLAVLIATTRHRARNGRGARPRRNLAEPPLGDEPGTDILVRGGFADLDWLSYRLMAGVHRDPVEILAAEVLRYFDATGFQGRVGVVSARAGRSSTTLALVSQQLADRPRIISAVPRRVRSSVPYSTASRNIHANSYSREHPGTSDVANDASSARRN